MKYDIVENIITIYECENGLLTYEDLIDNIFKEEFRKKALSEKIYYKIIIKDGITKIGTFAFYKLYEICEIILPDTIEYIEISAFEGCGIREVTLPKNEKFSILKNRLFYGCSNLTKLEIPDNIINIERDVLYNCSSLLYLKMSKNVTLIEFNILNMCKNLSELVIPGKTSFACYDLSMYNKITKLTVSGDNIPTDNNNLVNSGCYNSVINRMGFLKEFIIIGDCKNIYSETLASMNNLETIVIPKTIEKLTNRLFNYKGRLKHVFIGDVELTKSPENTLYNILNNDEDKLDELNIESIGEKCFYNSGIINFIIPKSVKRIGKNAFSFSTLLNITILTNNIKVIPSYCFNSTKITSIKLPSSVTAISNNAFDNCSNLKYVEFNNGLIKIDHDAFYNCISLQKIIIPDTVTDIGEFCFCSCKSLKDVKLSCKLTKLNKSIFTDCISLENINTENIIHYESCCFSNASSLEHIKISENTNFIEYSSFFLTRKLKSKFNNYAIIVNKLGGSISEVRDLGYKYDYKKYIVISNNIFNLLGNNAPGFNKYSIFNDNYGMDVKSYINILDTENLSFLTHTNNLIYNDNIYDFIINSKNINKKEEVKNFEIIKLNEINKNSCHILTKEEIISCLNN